MVFESLSARNSFFRISTKFDEFAKFGSLEVAATDFSQVNKDWNNAIIGIKRFKLKKNFYMVIDHCYIVFRVSYMISYWLSVNQNP